MASHDLQEPLRMVTSYTQLLNDLLQFSRVGTRAKPFMQVTLQEVIDDALQNLEKYIEEHEAEITIETHLPKLSVDGFQLTQLFQNLIHNAIKFRGDQPPKVWIKVEEQDDRWQFSITDNGMGIDQKHQDRIFMIFQRLHNRNKYEGSGIGLAICKKIVERHGGKIWVDSTPGERTTFFFTIAKGLTSPQEEQLNDFIEKPELTDKCSFDE